MNLFLQWITTELWHTNLSPLAMGIKEWAEWAGQKYTITELANILQ